jgi:hypothetical protein
MTVIEQTILVALLSVVAAFVFLRFGKEEKKSAKATTRRKREINRAKRNAGESAAPKLDRAMRRLDAMKRPLTDERFASAKPVAFEPEPARNVIPTPTMFVMGPVSTRIVTALVTASASCSDQSDLDQVETAARKGPIDLVVEGEVKH